MWRGVFALAGTGTTHAPAESVPPIFVVWFFRYSESELGFCPGLAEQEMSDPADQRPNSSRVVLAFMGWPLQGRKRIAFDYRNSV